MPRTIKKYPNRRLYDTETSQYMTLDDLRELVKQGAEIQVIDSKTKEDITRSVLLQIILEQEESGNPILTEQLLTQFIRFYGDAMQTFMGPYLEKSLQAFTQQQEAVKQQFSSVIEQSPFSAFSGVAEQNLEMWKSMQENFLKAYPMKGKDKDSNDSKD